MRTVQPQERRKPQSPPITISSVSGIDSILGILKQSFGTATATWSESLLRTLQQATDVLNFQSDKLDVQVDLMNLIAVHIAGINTKLDTITAQITKGNKDVQAKNKLLNLNCGCGQIIDKLASLPEILTEILHVVQPPGSTDKTPILEQIGENNGTPGQVKKTTDSMYDDSIKTMEVKEINGVGNMQSANKITPTYSLPDVQTKRQRK